jgi:hypothetical protein
MHICPQCRKSFDPPDSTHRFCPYCGAIRVLPDPPGSGVDGGLFIVGYDVIGALSGQQYRYSRNAERPQAVDAVNGPFTSVGDPGFDLFPSSSRPWLEYTPPHPTPPSNRTLPPRDKRLTPLWEVAVRHTRLFLLQNGGQLAAWDTRTLDFPRDWSFRNKWELIDKTTRMQVSETLVYALLENGTVLVAVEVGQGNEVFRIQLHQTGAQVFIDHGDVLILGPPREQSQWVERFTLQELQRGKLPVIAEEASPRLENIPFYRFGLTIRGEPVERCARPARLRSDFIFAAADGMLYRWGTEEERPQVLWPNPQDADLAHDWISMGATQLVYLTQPSKMGGEDGAVHVQLTGEKAEFAGFYPIPLLRDSRTKHVTGNGAELYFSVQSPHSSIELYRQSLTQNMPEPTMVATLPGTQDCVIVQIMMVPWQESFYLLVDYKEGLARKFVVVHPGTGNAIALDAEPHYQHDIRFVWEGPHLWMINLTEGRIQTISRRTP